MTLTEKKLLEKLEIASYAVSEDKMKAIIDIVVDWNVYISMWDKSLKNAERIMFPIADFLEKVNAGERWLVADKLELTIDNIKKKNPWWNILIEWYDEVLDNSLILKWKAEPWTVLYYKPETERNHYMAIDLIDKENKRYLTSRVEHSSKKPDADKLLKNSTRERRSFKETAEEFNINEWSVTTLSEALRIWYWVKEKDVLIIT